MINDSLSRMRKVDDALGCITDANDAARLIEFLRSSHSSVTAYFFEQVDALVWFTPLHEAGYFSPDKNPDPVTTEDGGITVSQWNVVPYLEKISLIIREGGANEYIKPLLDIIQDVSANPKDNPRTWWHFVKILIKLPNDRVPKEILELIPIWIKSKFKDMLTDHDIVGTLLPKFLIPDSPTDHEKALVILESILKVKWVPTAKGELFSGLHPNGRPEFYTDTYWQEEELIKNQLGRKIGSVIGLDAAQLLQRLLNEHLDKRSPRAMDTPNEVSDPYSARRYNSGDGSETWLDSLWEEGAYGTHEPNELLALLLDEILQGMSERHTDDTRTFFENLMADKQARFIFDRIAVHVMGEHWNLFGNDFWRLLMIPNGRQVLDDQSLKPELHGLFKRNVGRLTNDQKQLLEEILKQEPFRGREDRPGDPERLRALWRQGWYSTLKADARFEKLYSETKAITGKDVELEFGGPMWTGVIEKAPNKAPDLLEVENPSIVQFLLDYQPKDRFEGETLGGMANALAAAVRARPAKFANDLETFFEIRKPYVHAMIWALKDAWTEGKNFDWAMLLDSLQKYVQRDDLDQADELAKSEGVDGWEKDHLLRAIGFLLREATEKDEHAISKTDFDAAEKLLLTCIPMARPSDRVSDSDDPASDAINSARGSLLAALLYLALLKARVETDVKEKGLIRWSDDVKTAFENELESKNIDAYVTFGEYLPNLMYLDRDWTLENVKSFETSDDTVWKPFVYGYLAFCSRYQGYYKYMLAHYKRALVTEFEYRESTRALMRHMAIGYIWEIDGFGLGEEFAGRLISEWNPDRLEQYIYQISEYRKLGDAVLPKTKKPPSEKALEFWQAANRKVDSFSTLDKATKLTLGHLVRFVGFFQTMSDDVYQCVTKGALFAHLSYCEQQLFKSLMQFAESDSSEVNLLRVGDVLKNALSGNVPYFLDDDIHAILESIYQASTPKTKKLADDICNSLAEMKRWDLCQHLRDKYNP